MAGIRRRPASFRQAMLRCVGPGVLLVVILYPWLYYPWTSCPRSSSDVNLSNQSIGNSSGAFQTIGENQVRDLAATTTAPANGLIRHPQHRKQDEGAAALSEFSRELDYVQEKSRNRFLVHRWIQKNPSATLPRVLLASASSPTCEMLNGPRMAQKALVNKIAYAERHSNIDVMYTLENPAKDSYQWNRPMLWNRLLKKYRKYDWVFWIDSDVIILDLDFSIPFGDYTPYDIVMWGDKDKAYGIGDFKSIGPGIVMFKQGDFAIQFTERILEMRDKSRRVENGVYERVKQTIEQAPEFMNDQAAAAYLFRVMGDTWRERTLFETSYYLNGFWKEVGENLGKYAYMWQTDESKRPPFSSHFVGCSLCMGRALSEYRACADQFEKAYQFSMNRTARREMARDFTQTTFG